MSEGGRHDQLSLVQRQLVLRILPPTLLAQVRTSVSGGCLSQDIQIYRDEEQPSPPFQPAKNERMTFLLHNRKYPASLVDLPCPVETHRTFDLTTIYKSSDISQILIVYEDDDARLQAELDMRPRKGEQFYGNPQGLTPPSWNVAKRRFIPARSKLQGYHKKEVEAVEAELVPLFEGWQTGKSDKAMQGSNQISIGDEDLPVGAVKIFDEEEVVNFEEYMWSERFPNGRTIRETSEVAKRHPEAFLPNPKEGIKKTTLPNKDHNHLKNKNKKESKPVVGKGKEAASSISKKTADGLELNEENLFDDLYSGGGFDFDGDLESDITILSADTAAPISPIDRLPVSVARPTSQPTPLVTSPSIVQPIPPSTSISPPLLSSSSSSSSSSSTTTSGALVTAQPTVPEAPLASAFTASLQVEESEMVEIQSNAMEVDTKEKEDDMNFDEDKLYSSLKRDLETAETEKKGAEAKLKVIQEKHAETRNPVMKRRFEQDLNEAKAMVEAAHQTVEAKASDLLNRANELKN